MTASRIAAASGGRRAEREGSGGLFFGVSLATVSKTILKREGVFGSRFSPNHFGSQIARWSSSNDVR